MSTGIIPDRDINKEMRALVSLIASQFEVPENWPFTDENRIQLLRKFYYDARAIRDTEMFHKAELLAACQATTKCQSSP